jgi:hypothetical protein
MSESTDIISSINGGDAASIQSSMAYEFRAPKSEFQVEEIRGPTPLISIKHYDTALESLPQQGNESTNMSFHAYVAPTKKEIRIMNLKYDGKNDQVNSQRSGSQLLRHITNIGKNTSHDVYIDEDVSQLSLNNPYKTKVDLAKLKILERGYSFYNKAGFYPENFETIYRHNQKEREKPLSKYFKKERNLDDFNEALGSNFTMETPLAIVGEYISTRLNPSEAISDDFAVEVSSLLDKVNFKTKDRNLKYKNKT